jgi:cold shock CspA family protein
MNALDSAIATRPSPRKSRDSGWCKGKIKWFDPTRRFGWVIPDTDTGPDIFLPWLILQECGINEADMRRDAPVVFQWKPPERIGKRPEVTKIQKVIRR